MLRTIALAALAASIALPVLASPVQDRLLEDYRAEAARTEQGSSRRGGLLHRASHRTGPAGHASGSLDRCIRTPAIAGLMPAVS